MSVGLCRKCDDAIADKRWIQCSFCNNYYHKRCSKLDDNAVKAIVSNSAICWKCSSCSAFSFSDLVSKIAKLTDEISAMRNDFCMEISTLKSIIEHHPSVNDLSNGNSTQARVHTHHQPASSSASLTSPTVQAPILWSPSHVKSSARALSVSSADRSNHQSSTSSSTAAATAQLMSNKKTCSTDINNINNINNTGGALNIMNKLPSAKSNRNQRSSKLVFGTDLTANDLSVINPLNWLHISRFHPSVNSDKLKSYLVDKLDISSDLINCYPLIKKDANLELIRFINFKIGIPRYLTEKVMNPSIWPVGVAVKPFKFSPKNGIGQPQPEQA